MARHDKIVELAPEYFTKGYGAPQSGMNTLNIAVIGTGLIGKVHIAEIQQSAECQLSAIVDPSDSAREYAAEHQLPWYQSLEDVLAERVADSVILATPNKLHVEQALMCLGAGVPALIEKPVAHSIRAGQALLKMANDSKVPMLVGHHRMHSPIMGQAKAVIDSGKLGELVAINGSALFYKPDDYFEAGPWRTQTGGGPILINMIHEIGNLRYLCGEIVAVQAMASNARRQFQVEDTVSVSLQFANGVIGTFILSDTAASANSWEQTSLENPSYAAYPDEDCYQIAGTKGSLAVPTMRLKSYDTDTPASWWEPFSTTEQLELERQDPLTLQLQHFCRVIRGEESPLVTVFDGYQNLRVTEAIVEAAESGRTVFLDDRT